MDRQNVQAVTALRLFAFDKQHNSSPASSLDFGFREAMSSFKHTSVPVDHGAASAMDIRQAHSDTSSPEKEKTVILNDDQNHALLHPKGS